MKLLRIAAFAVVVSLIACGGDGKPERTIAVLRLAPTPVENQNAFLDELEKVGWRVGDNLTILDPDVQDIQASEEAAANAVTSWVDDEADLIVALSTSSAMVAADHAEDIPVVALANDLVGSGLVRDPDAPERNITGTSFRVPGDRTIDIATRLAPPSASIGILWPANDPAAEPVRDRLLTAATTLDVDTVSRSFDGPADVASAVAALHDAGAGALVLVSAPRTRDAFDAIEAATLSAGLPVVANSDTVEFAVLVLAPDTEEAYRQLARQAGRLLSGTDVSEVPVEDPGQFRLIVRDSVADRLHIKVPPDLIDLADEVEP